MKSKNNLSLTGAVASDVTVLPNRRNGSFTLIHHFGGDLIQVVGSPPEDNLVARPAVPRLHVGAVDGNLFLRQCGL